MTTRTSLATLGVLLAFAPAQASDCFVEGSGQLKTTSREFSDEKRNILGLERETCRLIRKGNVDDVMDNFTAEHGIILLDQGGVAAGREAQRARVKGLFSARLPHRL